jgi:hypothetical protein
MKLFKSIGIVLSSAGLLLLVACSNQEQATNSNPTPTSTSTSTPSPTPTETTAKTKKKNTAVSSEETTEKHKKKSKHPEASKGGQVVENGSYHLEFIPKQEEGEMHLDFYLQKGDNHEAVPNVKVTAKIQLPDGTKKTLDFKYDDAEKQYTAILLGTATGQYQVKMIAEIDGEKVDGRFSFDR